jgi:hypothetical protein
MSIVLNGTTGITTPDLTSAAGLDAADLTGTVASARLPAGSVLQVVNGNTSTAVTSTAVETWVDTGITATITPISATSKILVMVNICGMHRSASSAWNRTGIRVLRGATVLGIQALAQSWINSAVEFRAAGAMYSNYDSPATTTATTYKVQFMAETLSGTTSISVQRDSNSGTSQIFLMEIAA